MASRTLFHEMFYAYPLFGKDLVSRWGRAREILEMNQKAYGWIAPQDLTPERALLNIDTYVFYAFSTYIADFGVCVSFQASPDKGLTPGGFKLGLLRLSSSCKPPNAPPVRNPLSDPPLKRSLVAREEDINATLLWDSLNGQLVERSIEERKEEVRPVLIRNLEKRY
ncbi:hypothetical protein G7Y89_g8780 [Cudoniella acicularis]|uniref:Uncharacterized protein n=1 Tax=Cudoniella acicularis TaxID=354080 RepID=A0A8H4RI46_9HELO|nr:hypothetical protein G7Y89_g8780 [Cudoniella acicularis]